MLRERWPLIVFLVLVAGTAPFWHELLPDEHFAKPTPAFEGRSPQAIHVFDTKKSKSKDGPWRLESGPLGLDVTSWVGLPSRDVGCRIEKILGTKMSPYGCEDDLAAPGDPCIEKTAFYAGPLFPKESAFKVHPVVEDLMLDWEGGRLREMSVRLYKWVDIKDAKRLVHLPEPFASQLATATTDGNSAPFTEVNQNKGAPVAPTNDVKTDDVKTDDVKTDDVKKPASGTAPGAVTVKLEQCSGRPCFVFTAFAHVTNVDCSKAAEGK